jgi:glutathione S-transferase
MTGRRLLLWTVALLALPILVASFDIGVTGAAALVLALLLWRWLISLSALIAPARVPELELETISASHFVEKVRWCLDRLGVTYRERAVGGTLGAFFLGRTVPVLKFRSGAVRSSIGNSPEILRYLWGRYQAERPEAAEFLRPTPERLEFERRIDRCGVNLQVWVYFHILPDRELTLHAWGANSKDIPGWQRLALKLFYPAQKALMRRAFRISPAHRARAVEHIDEQLAEVEGLLSDGRRSILGGDSRNYTDIAFAAIHGLWLRPPGYGGGAADEVRIRREDCPPGMRQDIDRWCERFPLVTEFIESCYGDRRKAGP